MLIESESRVVMELQERRGVGQECNGGLGMSNRPGQCCKQHSHPRHARTHASGHESRGQKERHRVPVKRQCC